MKVCVCPTFPSVPAGALHVYLVTTIDEGVCSFVCVCACACVRAHFSFCPCRCIARIPGHNHQCVCVCVCARVCVCAYLPALPVNMVRQVHSAYLSLCTTLCCTGIKRHTHIHTHVHRLKHTGALAHTYTRKHARADIDAHRHAFNPSNICSQVVGHACQNPIQYTHKHTHARMHKIKCVNN